jgi:hypothetical protein
MPLALTKKKSVRLIVIVTIIAVILISFFVYLNNNLRENGNSPTNNHSPPFDFSISSGNSSLLLMQGDSVKMPIDIIQVNGTAETVSLASDVASSGILCYFSPPLGEGNFSSIVTLTVPNSTVSNTYKINFTATSKTTSHSLLCVVNVLNTKIHVRGKITFPEIDRQLYPEASVEASSLTFIDSQTNVTVFQTRWPDEYSVTLDNRHLYDVSIGWLFSPFIGIETGRRDGTWNGVLYVDAKVGEDTLTRDFYVNYTP